jgi:hypothetical protein
MPTRKNKTLRHVPSAPPAELPAGLKLPDRMPDEWLNQIQTTVKKDKWKAFWAALLGSSVIAAVITGFLNYRIESYKSQVLFGLEKFKQELAVTTEQERIRLQNRNDELSQKRTAHGDLLSKFRQFDVALREYIKACREASGNRGDAALAEYSVSRQGILVGQMSQLTASTSPDEFKEIEDRIDAILELVNKDIINADPLNDYATMNSSYEGNILPKIKEVMELLKQKGEALRA